MPKGIQGFQKGHKRFGGVLFKKGDKSFWKGKKLYKETKEKLKIVHLGLHVGEKNGRWVGGRTNYLRRNVFERDNYTCQKCGLKDYDILVIDHIKVKSLYPELKFVMDNLMTLCPNCHARKTLEDIKIITSKKNDRATI